MNEKSRQRLLLWLSDIPAALVLPFVASGMGLWVTRHEHPNSMPAMDGALLPLMGGLFLGVVIDVWRLSKRKRG